MRVILHVRDADRMRGKQAVSDRRVREQASDNSLQASNGVHKVRCHAADSA